MVIFGVTLVWALRNLKCSSIGWLEKPTLPTMRRLCALVCTPRNWMPWSAFVELDAVEHAEEIEVPPGAAELAVGRELEADLLLLLDDLLDLTVLDGLELGRRDRALLALGARLLQRGGTQEAADMVGAKRRFGSLH